MLEILNVSKAFGENRVLENVSFSLYSDSDKRISKPDMELASAAGPEDTVCRSHGVYCLMAPSGAGKTTLFRLILGLDMPDAGTITTDMGSRPYSVVFQEDRLCENFSPLENVRLAVKKTLSDEEIRKEISRLLPAGCLNDPVKTLSGGMKRRVAILRAVLSPSVAMLMDEPFTGLDEELRRAVIDYILEKRGGRLLLVATHQEEDVNLLGAQLLRLPGY